MAAVLVAAAVAGIWLGKSGASDDASGGVLEALGYIPVDATYAEIRAQRQAEHRLGIDGIGTGADDAQIKRYLGEADQTRWIDNTFTDYLMTMNGNGATFTALDVDWSATVGVGSPGTGSVVQIYRMETGLDLNSVADDMVSDGWRGSDVADGRRLQPDFTATDAATQMLGSYPARVTDLVLLPGEHLMVSGDYQLVLDVLAGHAEPLRGSDDVSQLLGSDDPEYAYLARDGQTCTDPAAVIGTQASPAEIEQLRKLLGLSAVRSPSATASVIFADGTTAATISRLLFDSDQEASADKSARSTYLRDGISISTRSPVADLLSVDSISVDGSLETVHYSFRRGPSEMLGAVAQRDLPPTLCLAG